MLYWAEAGKPAIRFHGLESVVAEEFVDRNDAFGSRKADRGNRSSDFTLTGGVRRPGAKPRMLRCGELLPAIVSAR
jgi:hypothetical protein